MSLDFDYSKVSHIPAEKEARTAFFDEPNKEGSTYHNPLENKEVPYDNWTVLETLIWRCMAVGLRGITEQNLQKFIERSAMWEYVHGGAKVSAESIAKHVGLTTNVSNETDARWRSQLVRTIERNSSAHKAAGFVSRRQQELAEQGIGA